MIEQNKIRYDKIKFTKALSKKRKYKLSRKRRIEQLKTQNQIIKFLKFNFVSKRKDIVIAINKSRTTIYDNLKKLKDLSVIDKISIKFDISKGAPFTIWFLTSEMKEVIGMIELIDIKKSYSNEMKEGVNID